MAGRPQKELDQKQFEALCSIWCTEDEICSILGTTDKTLNKWCKRTYNMNYSEAYKRYSTGGRISLRRKQKEVAMTGNVTMLIWLGKNVLGQSESPEISNDTEDSDSYFKEAGLDDF